jgi:hypothetical protein
MTWLALYRGTDAGFDLTAVVVAASVGLTLDLVVVVERID